MTSHRSLGCAGTRERLAWNYLPEPSRGSPPALVTWQGHPSSLNIRVSSVNAGRGAGGNDKIWTGEFLGESLYIKTRRGKVCMKPHFFTCYSVLCTFLSLMKISECQGLWEDSSLYTTGGKLRSDTDSHPECFCSPIASGRGLWGGWGKSQLLIDSFRG